MYHASASSGAARSDLHGEVTLNLGNLAQGGPACAESPIEIRSAATLDGSTWTRQATAGCEPLQIDRPWLAAYTPPAYRGTAQASAHTDLYYEYHDFGLSNIWSRPRPTAARRGRRPPSRPSSRARRNS